jgi:hypothetical protein
LDYVNASVLKRRESTRYPLRKILETVARRTNFMITEAEKEQKRGQAEKATLFALQRFKSQIVLILCSTPPPFTSFQPTPAKIGSSTNS